MLSTVAFRGYGVTQAAWAYESQIDLIAEQHIDRGDVTRQHRTYAIDVSTANRRSPSARFCHSAPA